jgi:hypothetical protein
LVPEAEALVKPLRDRCDPSAAVGGLARVTLLYPFKPPDEIGSAALDNLGRALRGSVRSRLDPALRGGSVVLGPRAG